MSKVETMGPWAAALYQIIEETQRLRIDIDISKFSKCILYRGGGMSLAEIEDFKENLYSKTFTPITLFGYSSCSLSRQ